MFIFVVLFALVSAQDYAAELRAGKRRFTSGNLKQATGTQGGLRYDITLVKGYHSLDYDEEVSEIVCGKDSVVLKTDKALNWKNGDVFTGDHRWNCGSMGVARVIEDIQLAKNENGKFEYLAKTKQAELEDIFEFADIEFENPEDETVPIEEAHGLKGASSWTKTFSTTKSKTLYSNSYFTSTLSATVKIPVTFNGFTVTVDSAKKTKTYKMTITSGLTFQMSLKNVASKAVSGSKEVPLYDFPSYSIPIQAGPVTITIKFSPGSSAGISWSFSAKATATLTYTKTFSAKLVFNSGASSKLTASASDTSTGATPKFTCGAGISGSLKPYVGVELEISAGVYGITVLSGTPGLKLRYDGSLTSKKISVTPKIIFDYSIKFLGYSLASGEKTIKSGTTKSVTYR